MKTQTNLSKEEAFREIFTPDILSAADKILARYETKRASILEILRLLQEHYGFMSTEVQQAAAHYLELPEIDVLEVVTFYSLLYKRKKAKNILRVCHTLSCSLLGAEEIIQYLEKRLGVKTGELTPDGLFEIERAECLGACELAPMMQVNDGDYVGPLTREKIDELIARVRGGKG